MKLQISPTASDIVICTYAVVTLYLRFKFESVANIGPVNSLLLGVAFVLAIWALIKLKILNPLWFGLFNAKRSRP